MTITYARLIVNSNRLPFYGPNLPYLANNATITLIHYPISSMLAQTRRSFTTRPARPEEIPALDRLLRQSRRSHIRSGWQPVTAWIGRAPAFVAENRFGLAGSLITPADPPPAAWVRAALVADGFPTAEVITPLLNACLDVLARQGVTTLSAMPTEPWLPPILDELGFAIVQEVENWEKRDLGTSRPGAQDLRVRPARQDDIPHLIPLEQAAFSPRWRYSAEALALALEKAATFTVAERRGEIVGFQVSLASDQWAHLVRLTVHPAAQQSGVGARLLNDALARYAALNLKSVSLNTQSDNLPSQRLYAAFDFRRVGPPLPVWERPV